MDKAKVRTDPHRPGAIVPVDYEALVQYELSREVEGETLPSFNVEAVVAAQQARTAGLFGSLGKCGVCGAWFYAGALWKHVPTGDLVHLGHDCEDKYSMVADRSEWERWHKEQADLRATAVISRKRLAVMNEFITANPGLDEAFRASELKFEGNDRDSVRRRGGVMILQDMRSRLRRFGSLSPKQVGFALKLATELSAPPPPAEKHVPAPEGRVTFTGKVVSVQERVNPYSYNGGTTMKVVVKVETSDGSWLAWGTAADSLFDGEGPLKGKTVTMTATLTRGNEPHFAFFKRPTKARVELLAPASV